MDAIFSKISKLLLNNRLSKEKQNSVTTFCFFLLRHFLWAGVGIGIFSPSGAFYFYVYIMLFKPETFPDSCRRLRINVHKVLIRIFIIAQQHASEQNMYITPIIQIEAIHRIAGLEPKGLGRRKELFPLLSEVLEHLFETRQRREGWWWRKCG